METRIKWVIIFFIFSFLLVFLKLFYWQVLKRPALQSLAANQYFSNVNLDAPRGKIYSSDGFPLVLNQKKFDLFLNLDNLKITVDQLKEQLLPIIGEEEKEKFLQKIELLKKSKNIKWFSLMKNLDEETKTKIENLKINGLDFEEKERRFYPEGNLLSHVLGFVGESEKGTPQGYFGIEGYYDKEISGKLGMKIFEKDALGRPVFIGNEYFEKPIPGRNLVLNIDRPLQFLVEKRLADGVKHYQANSGLVAIINPQNGAVIAMAAYPEYDPSTYYLSDQELFRNPIISSSFEPGSIFKVIVMAAAIDSGLISKDDICTECGGPKRIGEYSIKTWNEKYYPNSTMTDILVHSDNVGMVWIAEKLGASKLYSYLKKFGIGEKTGIDLQGEISPYLRDPNNWTRIDLATISFGQGIAVTPIQVLNAVSAIANGGKIYQPQVVRSILSDDEELKILPVEKSQPISSQTARIVTEMMVEAVEKGEAKWAKPKNYLIAGKTGTAQIPISGHYDSEKTIASFIGFAPINKPRFVMLVSLQEPKTSTWGSETAAPLWFKIAEDIFQLWNIQPDKN